MSFVLDTSVTMAWLFEDEATRNCHKAGCFFAFVNFCAAQEPSAVTDSGYDFSGVYHIVGEVYHIGISAHKIGSEATWYNHTIIVGGSDILS